MKSYADSTSRWENVKELISFATETSADSTTQVAASQGQSITDTVWKDDGEPPSVIDDE